MRIFRTIRDAIKRPPRLPSGFEAVEMHDEQRSYYLVLGVARTDHERLYESSGRPDSHTLILIDLIGPGGTLIDVGANLGSVCVPAAAAGLRTYAIEADTFNCERLRLSAKHNRTRYPMRVVQCAASNIDGVVRFTSNGPAGKVLDDGAEEVDAFRLDTLMRSWRGLRRGRVGIKIDVEGHEKFVVEGASKLIHRYRPFVVFESIEVHGHRGWAHEVRRTFESLGYRLFLVYDRFIIPRRADDIQYGHVSDYLAVPNELAESFPGRLRKQFEVRQLTPDEEMAWLDEMRQHGDGHQRHYEAVIRDLNNEVRE
jgi:FkbM family methyltransferase